ncbi:MAG: thermonuclease family protein [Nitratireductor sp.]
MARIVRKPGIRRRGSIRDWLTMLALFAAIAFAAAYLGGSEPLQGRAIVVDGDSLGVNGERIRLEGIDAPEYRQSCTNSGAEIACGKLARDHLRKLIARQDVTCTALGLDKYDRTLAICRAGERNLNEAMVRDGWAVAYGDHQWLEAEARNAKRGMWAYGFEEPSDWRKDHSGEETPRVSTNDSMTLRAKRMFASLIAWLKSLI